jgi:hypothetical protein
MPNRIYIQPYPSEQAQFCVFLGTTVLGGGGTLKETGVNYSPHGHQSQTSMSNRISDMNPSQLEVSDRLGPSYLIKAHYQLGWDMN